VNPACWKTALVAARQQPTSHRMSIHGSAAVSLSVMTPCLPTLPVQPGQAGLGDLVPAGVDGQGVAGA
jgi:hypothetical protein